MGKRISNLRRLRESLCREYEKLIDDDSRIEHANAVSRMAGVLIMSCKIEMDYAELTGTQGPIDFLGGQRQTHIEPRKPSLSEMVMQTLESIAEPIDEQALCEAMIATGQLPGTYINDHQHQQGGPYALIRGVLLKEAHEGALKVDTHEGRAVFQLERQLA